jgi:hypothetical protein
MRVGVAVPAVLCALLVSCESNPTKPLTASRPLPDVAAALAAQPTQSAADDISANIQSLHLLSEFPNPTIVDSRFGSDDPAEAGYTTVVGYAHAGDAAIWTGHYLAAEAKRFEVTRSGVFFGLAVAFDAFELIDDAKARKKSQRQIQRVNTDFLWQRSPFLVRPDREPTGTIETAAIDYLLPYWMARHYRVLEIRTIQ